MKEQEVKKYIIEIVGSGKPTYYTKGLGDPCRTHYPKYAQMYEYIESAHKAIKKLRSQYPERKFQVRTVLVSVEILF